MTIHQNMARDLLATGASDLQDAYRIAWMKGIPATLRRKRTNAAPTSGLERGTLTLLERAAARRDELAKVIMPMNAAGATVPQIARAAKCSCGTVRRVIRENGSQSNPAARAAGPRRNYVSYMPEVHALRQQGLAWLAVGKKLGVCRDRLRETYATWEAQQ